MIYKHCSRCGRRLRVGETCSCQTAYKKNYNKFNRDKAFERFRHSKEWLRIRQAVIDRDDGIDQYALRTTGKLIPGTSVHHIIPLADDWSRRLDMSNLILLSEQTHGEIEKIYHTKDKSAMQEVLFSILKHNTEGAMKKFR